MTLSNIKIGKALKLYEIYIWNNAGIFFRYQPFRKRKKEKTLLVILNFKKMHTPIIKQNL